MLYPMIKVSKDTQKKFFISCITIICILIYVWYVLCGVQLQLDSAIIKNNTDLVQQDSTAVKVEHINGDGDLYLEDMSKVEADKVKTYVRTSVGTGTYYIPEGKMSAEISKTDAVNMGKRFMVLDWVVLIMLICLVIYTRGSKKSSILLSIGYLVSTFIDCIILKFYLSEIVKTAFPVSWVCVGRLIVFLIFTCIIYRKRRRV